MNPFDANKPAQNPERPDHDNERIEQLRRAMYSRRLSQSIKERPRRELERDPEIVPDDWHKREDPIAGVRVAPRFIGVTRSVLWWLLVLSIAFFALAAGVFGYYFTLGGGSLPANPENIDITVSGPPQVAGGEPVELQISVTNRNRVPLDLADLVVTFPPGTRKVTDFETDLPKTRLSLGTIEPGGRRQGTISAVFSGATGQPGNVKVELEYRVEGSSAIFVASQDYSMTFTSSPLSISIDGNTQTTSGQPVQFTVTVASNASAPIKDVVLDVRYPFGFKFGSASPEPTKGSATKDTGTWSLGDFAPGQRKSILVQGVLAGEQGDKRIFRLFAGTKSATSTGSLAKLAENSWEMQISQPFLGLAIAVNAGQQQATQNTFAQANSATIPVASPNTVVTVSVSYVNNLTTEISDAVVVARLSGLSLGNQHVRVSDGFYRSTDDTIIWDKTTTGGALNSLAPGAKGVLTFSFTTPNSDSLKNVTDPKIDINVNAAGKRLSESGVPQSLQSTARQQIKLASDLQIASQALYAQNPFGVSGPMPPKAGLETAYAIVLTVTNSTSKIQNAKVTAKLPPYVRWIGSHAPRAENLIFNQYEGEFIWNLGDIQPGSGLNGAPPRQIAISVGFTPSTSQIGEQPVLIQDVTLVGTDTSTGLTVQREANPDVSTNLQQIGKSSSNVTVNPDAGFQPINAIVVK